MERITISAVLMTAGIAGPAASAVTPTIIPSSKGQAEIVACLSDEIGKFDNPNVRPAEGGSVRITTHVMHVTRIDIAVAANPAVVTVRNRMKGKLKAIVEGCL